MFAINPLQNPIDTTLRSYVPSMMIPVTGNLKTTTSSLKILEIIIINSIHADGDRNAELENR